MENLAAKRIQRFYQNYIKWEFFPDDELDEDHEESKLHWPIDPIMDEPFHPNFKIRILNKTGSYQSGRRHKLQVFNVGTLWQSIVITHSLDNPITEDKFDQEQFMKIADFALKTGVVTKSKYKSVVNKHFPTNGNGHQINQITHLTHVAQLNTIHLEMMKKIRKDHLKLLVAGLTGENTKVVELLLKNGNNIDHDKLLPNKYIPLSELTELVETEETDSNESSNNDLVVVDLAPGAETTEGEAESEEATNSLSTTEDTEAEATQIDYTKMFPKEIIHINLIQAIAYGCDDETFIYATQMGCDPAEADPLSGAHAFHFAALANNIEIMKLANAFNPELVFTDSKIGTPLSLLKEPEVFMSMLFT